MGKGLPMLRQIRQAQGYSLRALAAKVGMAYPALFRLESGEADPRLSTLRKLAKALNVTVAEIIGEGKPARQARRK
jgi:transcriptional regulator with XRE-family HTH domain